VSDYLDAEPFERESLREASGNAASAVRVDSLQLARIALALEGIESVLRKWSTDRFIDLLRPGSR
jgi:hypothetical protein